jgi:predicted metal-binding membrane protein
MAPGLAGGLRWPRHGLFCGLLLVLMALLFVGGTMNLAWIAALGPVAMKSWPGNRLSHWLGVALIAAGLVRLVLHGLVTLEPAGNY